MIGGPQLATQGTAVNYPPPGQPGQPGQPATVPRLPSIVASSFVVADAGTGQVLAARDPHGRYLPASTLKVLTAISMLPVLSPDTTTVASPDVMKTVPNVAGLVPGQPYKISDLFTALLTISANDAAIALVEASGSYAKGIALMNAEATHLRADDTHAVNPNGLNAPGQLTSAYDLALIARQALSSPAFMHYDEVRTAPFLVKPGKSETLYNQNTLLTNYPGGIGGKIGWTSAAGATYVGLARRGDVTLIATLLHCPSLTEITSAEKLLTWGFAVDGKIAPVGTLVNPLTSSAPRRTAPQAGRASAPDQARRTATPNAPSLTTIVASAFTVVAVIVAGWGLYSIRRRRRRVVRRPAGGRRSPETRPERAAPRPDGDATVRRRAGNRSARGPRP